MVALIVFPLGEDIMLELKGIKLKTGTFNIFCCKLESKVIKMQFTFLCITKLLKGTKRFFTILIADRDKYFKGNFSNWAAFKSFFFCKLWFHPWSRVNKKPYSFKVNPFRNWLLPSKSTFFFLDIAESIVKKLEHFLLVNMSKLDHQKSSNHWKSLFSCKLQDLWVS